MYGGMSHIRVLDSDIFSANNVTWGSLLPSVYTEDNYLSIYPRESGFRHEMARLVGAQYQLTTTFRKPEETIVTLKLTLDERHDRENVSGKISTTTQQYFSLFMSGKLDPEADADWQKYQKEMEACGLSKLVGIYQDAYDRK